VSRVGAGRLSSSSAKELRLPMLSEASGGDDEDDFKRLQAERLLQPTSWRKRGGHQYVSQTQLNTYSDPKAAKEIGFMSLNDSKGSQAMHVERDPFKGDTPDYLSPSPLRGRPSLPWSGSPQSLLLNVIHNKTRSTTGELVSALPPETLSSTRSPLQNNHMPHLSPRPPGQSPSPGKRLSARPRSFVSPGKRLSARPGSFVSPTKPFASAELHLSSLPVGKDYGAMSTSAGLGDGDESPGNAAMERLWGELDDEQRDIRQSMLKKMMRNWQGQAMRGGWDTWRELIAERKVNREKMRMVVVRMKKNALLKAFNVWKRVCENDYRKKRLYRGMMELVQPFRDAKTNGQFFKACRTGDFRAVDTMLEVHGRTMVDGRDWRGRTPLHAAAGRGHTQIAELLVERGADIFAEDARKKLPMDLAIAGGPRATDVAEKLMTLMQARGWRDEHTETKPFMELQSNLDQLYENVIDNRVEREDEDEDEDVGVFARLRKFFS